MSPPTALADEDVAGPDAGFRAESAADEPGAHVSAIGMRAGAARLGLPDFPRRSLLERLFGQIETSSRAAMADLHRMLDLLHGAHRDGQRTPAGRYHRLVATTSPAGPAA